MTIISINGLWSLKPFSSDPYHSYLVTSTLDVTVVSELRGSDLEDVTDGFGFDAAKSTLLAKSLNNGWLIQVCKQGFNLCKPGGKPSTLQWRTEETQNILLSAVQDGMILLALAPKLSASTELSRLVSSLFVLFLRRSYLGAADTAT